MLNDTICAIATADVMGAVSLIRISGDEAIGITERLIGKDLSAVKGYSIVYGTIKDHGEPVDDVLVSVFRAPKSYTGEDVIELGCHAHEREASVFILVDVVTAVFVPVID